MDDDAQLVFDTVMGPNLRFRDNLIQLVVIVVGTLIGVAVGLIWGGEGAVLGGFIGLLGSLLISGTVIGLVRPILAVRRRAALDRGDGDREDPSR